MLLMGRAWPAGCRLILRRQTSQALPLHPPPYVCICTPTHCTAGITSPQGGSGRAPQYCTTGRSTNCFSAACMLKRAWNGARYPHGTDFDPMGCVTGHATVHVVLARSRAPSGCTLGGCGAQAGAGGASSVLAECPQRSCCHDQRCRAHLTPWALHASKCNNAGMPAKCFCPVYESDGGLVNWSRGGGGLLRHMDTCR